ncbi:unnamed protein product, partial [Staurois parvus]
MSARSCDQLCPITADRITDDQCALMISVAPAVPPVSVHQCQLSVFIHATCQCHISAYQCTSMPHISAHLRCLSVPPISARQCRLPVCISALSAACQCHLSVPYISAAFQCPSVMP